MPKTKKPKTKFLKSLTIKRSEWLPAGGRAPDPVVLGGAGVADPPALSAGIYLSEDSQITPEDTLLWKGRISFPALASATTFSLPIDPGLGIPETVAAGAWTIGVLVDDMNAVVERDETNHVFSLGINLTSAGYSHLELLEGWPYWSATSIETDESRNLAVRGYGGLLEIMDIVIAGLGRRGDIGDIA